MTAPKLERGEVLPARAVLIDLDGTLLDTIADLAAAANAALADLGMAARPVEMMATFVGKGVEVLMHRALTGILDGRAEPARFGPAIEAFHHHYERINGLHSTLYPGVIEGLDAMRGMGLTLACVTNKPQSFSDALLERTGLARYFELVLGGDALPRKKPDPMPLIHACERMGVPVSEAVMIGDSVNDALAARAAGMPVFIVPYGYNEGHDVHSLDVDAIVDSLDHASSLLRRAGPLPRSRND
jgi:phosphoglycolate phosphatase